MVSPGPAVATSLVVRVRVRVSSLDPNPRLVDQPGAGLTTDEIDAVVHKETVARGAYPSPLNPQPKPEPRPKRKPKTKPKPKPKPKL